MAHRRLNKPARLGESSFGGGKAAEVLVDKINKQNLNRKVINKLCSLFHYVTVGVLEIKNIKHPGFRTMYKKCLYSICLHKMNHIRHSYNLEEEIFTYMMNVISRHIGKQK